MWKERRERARPTWTVSGKLDSCMQNNETRPRRYYRTRKSAEWIEDRDVRPETTKYRKYVLSSLTSFLVKFLWI